VVTLTEEALKLRSDLLGRLAALRRAVGLVSREAILALTDSERRSSKQPAVQFQNFLRVLLAKQEVKCVVVGQVVLRFPS
jgi:hypothetical protein